jgi:hypothetical protein
MTSMAVLAALLMRGWRLSGIITWPSSPIKEAGKRVLQRYSYILSLPIY